jgi:hypothetical protein
VVFLDAMYVARGKALRNRTLAGVICFQLQESEFSRFIIQELAEAPEESENPLEWRSFVKMCRRRFINYPHMFRKDGFSGPICNNAEKVRQMESKRPQTKIVNNRKPTQMCIKSTNMASKFESSIIGVYMISVTS